MRVVWRRSWLPALAACAPCPARRAPAGSAPTHPATQHCPMLPPRVARLSSGRLGCWRRPPVRGGDARAGRPAGRRRERVQLRCCTAAAPTLVPLLARMIHLACVSFVLVHERQVDLFVPPKKQCCALDWTGAARAMRPHVHNTTTATHNPPPRTRAAHHILLVDHAGLRGWLMTADQGGGNLSAQMYTTTHPTSLSLSLGSRPQPALAAGERALGPPCC